MKKAVKRKLELPLPNEIELISSVGLQIRAELDLNRLLKLIVEKTQETFHYAYGSVLLREGDDLVIRAVTEYPIDIIGKTIPIGQGITGRCAYTKKRILIPDLSRCDYYIHLGDRMVQSELAIPIIFQDKLLGVLNTESAEKNAYSDRDVRILEFLSSQIAVAIRNAQTHSQLELLQTIGIQLNSITNLEKLLAIIVQEVKNTLHYDSAAIFLKQGEHLVLKAITKEFPPEMIGLKIPIGQGVTGRCAREEKVINIGDIPNYSDYIPSGIEGIQSEIASPLLFENKLAGVLTIESKRKNSFDTDDIRLLTILCSQIAVAIRNANLYAELERLAITDPLTGLYNYRYYHNRLAGEMARASRYRHPLSQILIDLDDFKRVNDLHGHLAGDEVLKTVAQLIRKNIRKYDENTLMEEAEIDIAARYGGEELIIILPETDAEGAIQTAERLRKLLAEQVFREVNLNNADINLNPVTGSFGVTSYIKGESPEAFLQRTDQAMYEAKRLGKNQVFFLK
jgi:diguanylate cyclase (GGDEF)-like protein